MPAGRSEITIDLDALARNVALLVETASPAEVWAVVKADAYGHGAVDCARVALGAGATTLCTATAREGAELRSALPESRVIVMSPLAPGEDALAREARLEVCLSTPAVPDGLDLHLKVDSGMGRWGMSAEDALSLPRERVVGVMSHLAAADEEDESFTLEQIERFRTLAAEVPGVTAHLANSAGALRFPASRFDAVRCGVALAKTLAPGESTGYGRRFVADRPTRIGIVPVGYADGFRRGLTGTEVLVAGTRRRVLGTVSMDSLAVELGGEPEGAPVTLIGEGVLAEEHARVLGTINYEITCGIGRDPRRADRRVVGG